MIPRTLFLPQLSQFIPPDEGAVLIDTCPYNICYSWISLMLRLYLYLVVSSDLHTREVSAYLLGNLHASYTLVWQRPNTERLRAKE